MTGLKAFRRKQLQVTLAELAKGKHITARRLSQIENGVSVPIFRKRRERFAKIYGLSLADFEALLEGKGGFSERREKKRRGVRVTA
jgi:transcriptional regulator with XRE-family HTH domain